jgi:hypothetical protein
MIDMELQIRSNIGAIVAEYEAKKAELAAKHAEANSAITALHCAATVQGVYGNTSLHSRIDSLRCFQDHLRNSVWLHVYKKFNIDLLMSPGDKSRFETQIGQASVPEFNIENLKATFGRYIQDPMAAIARAFAEVFCGLDPYYKSHEKVKVGVKGLPKRIIMKGRGSYWTWEHNSGILAVMNALAAGMQLPILDRGDIDDFIEGRPQTKTIDGKCVPVVGDSVLNHVTVKTFENENIHLFFKPKALEAINKMLALYYGETLPDAPEETDKPRASTAVSKDLQYYPTPEAVAEQLASYYASVSGMRVLDPSCGCGRLLDAAKKHGAASTLGIEYDAGRAMLAKAKGHKVATGNFLEVAPPVESEKFDVVLMNPPFYGKHYFKHLEHAKKFIKTGGTLLAILPATARYDHGLITGLGTWYDLPMGSFSESGTNVNTCVYHCRIR